MTDELYKAFSDTEHALWKNRITRAERSKEPLERAWRVLIERYEGEGLLPEDGSVNVNLMFSIVRQLTATLSFKDPSMYGKGMTPRGEAVAHLVTNSILPIERRIMKASNEERDALKNAVLCGTGILMHGYNAEFGMFSPYSGKAEGDNPSDEEGYVPGAFTEHDTRVQQGHPWVRSIHPMDLLVDSEASEFDSARWIARKIRRAYSDCRRDTRYAKEARAILKPSGSSQWWDNKQDGVGLTHPVASALADDASMCSLYEIYDRVTNRIIVLAENCDKALMVYRFPLLNNRGPYRFLSFYRKEKCPWGISLALQFLPQSEAINLLRTQMMQQLENWGWPKGFYRATDISDNEARKFAQSRSTNLTKIDSDVLPKDAIHFMPQPEISADAWNLVNTYRSDLDEVSGINENARGGSSGGTATEASIVAAQGGVRTEDMLDKYVGLLRDSTQCVVSILRTFWGPERTIPLVGPDGGVVQQFSVSFEDINAEFEIDIEPGSTVKYDSATRMRQIIDLMGSVANFVPYLQQQGSDLNWTELFKRLFKETKLFGYTDSIIVPMPPPPAPSQPPQGMGAVQPPGAAGGVPSAPAASPLDQFGQTYSGQQGFENGRAMSELMGAN